MIFRELSPSCAPPEVRSVGNVGDANGVCPVPTCAPPGSFAPSLGSWEFSFGRRAPERELPTAYPSPTFPTEQTSGGGLGLALRERSLGERTPEERTSGGGEVGGSKPPEEGGLGGVRGAQVGKRLGGGSGERSLGNLRRLGVGSWGVGRFRGATLP